jgi:hypothetical protein
LSAALIFVFSDQPGPYVNALSYLYDKRDVSIFKFVFVTGASTEPPKTDLVESIIKAVEDLSQGIYCGNSVDIDPLSQASYASIASTLRNSRPLTRVIPLDELSTFLSGQIDGNIRSNDVIVDVTGLPKVLMAHVMLICHVGGHAVHTFELRNQANRRRPELSLYFSLPLGGYGYPSLSRDVAVQQSVRKLVHIRRMMWTTTLVSVVAFACFAVLLMVDSRNILLAVIGLAANIVGILGSIVQAMATRK